MATYAAYRHIELDNVGYGKKRVLKPPGGGSSDIFGASGELTPRKPKQNPNQSQLSNFFSADSQDGGPVQSNGAGSTGTGSGASSQSGGSAPDTPRSTKPDGNPVTGAGYDGIQQNGGSTGSSIAGSDKSSTDSSPSVGGAVPRMKNRVPPGGFSSGLW